MNGIPLFRTTLLRLVSCEGDVAGQWRGTRKIRTILRQAPAPYKSCFMTTGKTRNFTVQGGAVGMSYTQ
jgi:hypothetical protein